jgi:hypothetical protein
MALETRRGDLLADFSGQLAELDDFVAEEATWSE